MNLIAEFGVNWNDNKTFESMIARCVDLNIKFVKMQLFKIEDVPKEVESMYIDIDIAHLFFNYAKAHNIELFFTPMYPAAVNICLDIGVNYYKVRYIDRMNLSLYRKLKSFKKPIFVSTNHPDNTLYKNLRRFKKKDIQFLYCVPEYPAKKTDYFLKMRDNSFFRPLYFDGISDHTPDLDLFEMCLPFDEHIKWFEMHVCIDRESAYEGKWSKTFDEIAEVLNSEKINKTII